MSATDKDKKPGVLTSMARSIVFAFSRLDDLERRIALFDGKQAAHLSNKKHPTPTARKGAER